MDRTDPELSKRKHIKINIVWYINLGYKRNTKTRHETPVYNKLCTPEMILLILSCIDNKKIKRTVQQLHRGRDARAPVHARRLRTQENDNDTRVRTVHACVER